MLPVTVDSARYIQAADDGFTFAFPQALTSAQAKMFDSLPPDWNAYVVRATGLGGAIMGDAAIQVVLRGNAASTAVITGIRVVRHCTAPLSGTLLDSPPAASDHAIQVGFNLDHLFPVAQNYQSGKLSGSYFASHSISLRRGATQTMVVHAVARRHYCQLTMQLLIDTAQGHVTEPITNKGKQFAVTGAASIGSYHALYAGGVLSPAGNDHFVRVSAQALVRITHGAS